MKGQVKICFGQLKILVRYLINKSSGFRATSLSTYNFSTLYTTLPHNLIKEKLINLIEWTFKREGSPYIASNEIRLSSLLKTQNDINFGPVKTCVKLNIPFG